MTILPLAGVFQDERIGKLLEDLTSMDENHKMLVLNLRRRHKTDLCEL
jgi:hypothetical protein